MPEQPYEMTLTLNVLDHLGLNLYSSVPAVIAEAIANCWDADATKVEIALDYDAETITISDDGCGMTREDINQKYLMVGYKRRENGPTQTPKFERHVMGRKGIGKLSLFSIADEIEVHSIRVVEGEDHKNAFVMRTEDIKNEMGSQSQTYHPEPLNVEALENKKGTRLILRELKKQISTATLSALRKRLARRFAIIGPANSFRVSLNDVEIGVADRAFYPKIEYLWSIGDVADEYEELCVNARSATQLGGVVDAQQGRTVRGWLGTFDEQKSIDDENNTISVLAWGKLVEEDILADIKEGGLFTKYLIGELHADFLDRDDEADIATSDRQRLKEDDPRVQQLRDFVKANLLRPVGSAWRDLRSKDALSKATQNPAVKEWFDSLAGDARSQAQKLFGKIGSLASSDQEARKELYRHAILAFERLRFRDALSVIDELEDNVDFSVLDKAFTTIDDLEAAQYHQIARGRLEVIDTFSGIANTEKEKVIQKYLFDHLWLLDPSWERASASAQMEQAIKTEFAGIDAGLTEEEQKGRVDIRYTTTAGKHVVIELKKYDVAVKTTDLLAQLKKYYNALDKYLRQIHPKISPHIETVAVLGHLPSDFEPEEQSEILGPVNGRIVTYDGLIDGAQLSYREYVDSKKDISKISSLLDKI